MLDYFGSGFNCGFKVVIVVMGNVCCEFVIEVLMMFWFLVGFDYLRVCFLGVFVI